MGCGGSQQIADADDRSAQYVVDDLPRLTSSTSGLMVKKQSSGKLARSDSKVAHERLRKLQELDASTKIPFILIELRGEAHGRGFVEVCGKDEYGVYAALDEWLTSAWGCTQLEAGDLSDDTPLPFSERTYAWSGFRLGDEAEGTSSMGRNTMDVVNFMCNQLSWTLGVINGGNVGRMGEVREQQIIFKAPHPMNLTSPHIMVELRSAGYIEVCGIEDGNREFQESGIADELEEYFIDAFKAERVDGHEMFCDRYYKCGEDIFLEYGGRGDNNLGLLTVQVCDFIGKGKPWSLVTMNGGNYGETGSHREQQLVFRLDSNPLGEQPHFMVELRDAGFIEVNGENVGGIYDRLTEWLKQEWGASRSPAKQGFCHRKYSWRAKDMMEATAELTKFFHQEGWQMQICSQGTVKVKGSDDSREQQIIFRPGASAKGVVEPHLVLDLFMGEGDPQLYDHPEVTQVLADQRLRVCPVMADDNQGRERTCAEAVEQLARFLEEYLGGTQVKGARNQYSCDVFMTRGFTENNLGFWTMRICDFMVDRLGWSLVVCNVCNLGGCGQHREQQLVFRWDGGRRDIPVTKESELFADPGRYAAFDPPGYWTTEEVRDGRQLYSVVTCEQDEVSALQDIIDRTFKRVLTRDRVYEYQAETNEEMPYRLEVKQAFRAENVPVLERYRKRRAAYGGGSGEEFAVRSREGGEAVNGRLLDGEALLFHGTNPSSSMNILKGGFVLDNAGKSTGTMFGYGVYLAEAASKSDEYARDDQGGTYPGLRAMLVCRCLVGKPLVVEDAGDYVRQARDGGYDCVVGDREKKVGTYREYVFFDEGSIVPEYSIIYQRVYDANKVPARLSRMKTRTFGSTGRAWQVRFDKGWGNVPPDVNLQILQALKDGQSSIDVTIGCFEYTFDIAKKTQRNKMTGTERQIRAPRFS